jgi:hypothetical protein
MSPDVSAWLARAVADANARKLPALPPLLETLAKSLQALRDADGEFGHPASQPPPPSPQPPTASPQPPTSDA